MNWQHNRTNSTCNVMEAIKSCSTELHVSSMLKTIIHLTITINEYSNTLFIMIFKKQFIWPLTSLTVSYERIIKILTKIL